MPGEPLSRASAHSRSGARRGNGAVERLARNESRYKELLAECDLPRRNDLDDRGNLSEEALAEFTRFFLETCLDQVRFMEQLAEPNRLRDRMLLWVEEEVRACALAACPLVST